MSKPFRFRLEVALRQRVRHEQAVQLALSRTLQGRNAAVAELSRMEVALANEKRLADQPAPVLDPDIRMGRLYYLDRAAQRLKQQRATVGQWETEVRQVQETLRHASSRRRALERLRERQQQAHGEQLERQAARELDELSMLHFGRSDELGGQAYALLVD
jgi:flagellar export protein FliJ